MRRILRFKSARFSPKTSDYSYPQLRTERPRVSRRLPESNPAGRERSGLPRTEQVERLG